LENVCDGKDKNRALENIEKNIKTSAKNTLSLHELKQHKPWFDGEYLVFLDQRDRIKCGGYKMQAKAILII